MNGTFKVALSMPMGLQSGTINFIDDNGILNGSIHAMGSVNPFRNGKISGNTFEFTGTLKIFFNRFDYTAKGTVIGDTLKATAETKYGIMQISGTRI
jgi:hypothetical protein